MRKKIFTTFFIVILLLTILLSFMIIKPYLSYILLAVIIAYSLRPLYHLILSKIRKEWLAATIMLIIVFLLIIIPSAILLTKLISQSYNALSSINSEAMEEVSMRFSEMTGTELDLAESIIEVTTRIKNYVINQSFNLITSTMDLIIGIAIMFFLMYYLFKDGHKIMEDIKSVLPLKQKHSEVLIGEIGLVTNAVIYGQLITGIIQGTLAGIGFIIFGIPNAIFWGFIMIILSFLPIIGAYIIYIPAGIIEIMNQNYFSGIGIIIYGTIIVSQIDNVIKPLIISRKAKLNSALVFIGVIGGLKVFGFIGFLLGPLVLALLLVMLKTFKEDFKPSNELEEVRKQPSNYLVIKLQKRPFDQHRRPIKKIINKKEQKTKKNKKKKKPIK